MAKQKSGPQGPYKSIEIKKVPLNTRVLKYLKDELAKLPNQAAFICAVLSNALGVKAPK